MTRTRTETHRHITVWLPHDQVAALDAHLARAVARVPGARPSRHGWLATLVARELAALAETQVPEVRS